jgi:Putative zinc-finger
MSCPFAQDDAAYVLGALSPAERLEYERHMTRCPDCTRAVRELAGMPGLLSRVDPEVITALPVEDPLPATVLPRLAHAARRSRRRRLLAAAGAAAAASAVAASLVVSRLDLGEPTSTQPGSTAAPAMVHMRPVGEVPVVADLAMENVTWGTRLELTCTYDTTSVDFRLPPRVDYYILVLWDDGRAERVGSWKSLDGRTMRLTVATAAPRAEISAVEVRTVDKNRLVLKSTA